MKYITAKKFAKKWGISQRRVYTGADTWMTWRLYGPKETGYVFKKPSLWLRKL